MNKHYQTKCAVRTGALWPPSCTIMGVIMLALLATSRVLAEPSWYPVSLKDGRTATVLVLGYDERGIVYQVGEETRLIPVSSLAYESLVAFHYVTPTPEQVKAARD